MKRVKNTGAIRFLWPTLALCVAVSACSNGGEKEEEFITASRLCQGAFVYAPKSLEKLRDTHQFRNEDSDFLDVSAKEIRDIHAEEPDGRIGKCYIPQERSKRSLGSTEIGVFGYEPRDLSNPERLRGKTARYRLGKLAIAGPWDAQLYFECVSPQFEDSSKRPARVVVVLNHFDRHGTYPTTLRETNMKVVYSASLALARKLECKNDGGLPGRLVLKQIG
ncbi:hypothetical protein ACZ90_04970 [Streptomyces albus subsp. albus]|nr:hypothetical protein ACZ90_04970 [Streptomyces albus subsp. albus]